MIVPVFGVLDVNTGFPVSVKRNNVSFNYAWEKR